jgi:CHASE2 domain-containing sensor protein
VAPLVVGLFSLAITGFVAGLRSMGSLQSLELAVYDRLVQAKPDPGVDPRLTIVSITETDIQSLQRFPIPDGVIAQVLQKVKTYQPRAIGLDLLRDIPQQPGRQQFLNQLKTQNLVVITNLGNPPTPPPKGIPPEQVGFNDLPLDPGDVVRRNLMFANVNNQDYYSFSLRLALVYLNKEGIDFEHNDRDREIVRLGKASFEPLEPNTGGYQNIDARGYQILLHYRSRNIAQQVSLSDVLNGKVEPAWFKDRVVLIGTTAATAKDLLSTPYSTTNEDIPRMPGVLIHAQMVSQILDAALTGKSLFWFWAEWVEVLWIATWAIAGGIVAWFVRYPLWLGLSGVGLIVGLLATCYGLFLIGGWVPFVAPAIAASLCGGLIVAYWAYINQRLGDR